MDLPRHCVLQLPADTAPVQDNGREKKSAQTAHSDRGRSQTLGRHSPDYQSAARTHAFFDF